MKFAMKSLVAAAAIAAGGYANAAVVTAGIGQAIDVTGNGKTVQLALQGGTGTLSFSVGPAFDGTSATVGAISGVVGALNVGKVVITGTDGAVVTEGSTPNPRGTLVRSSSKVAAAVTSITADTSTGQILTVGSTGGAQQVAAYLDGVLEGGKANVGNLRFDIANGVVLADWKGQALNPDDTYGPEFSATNQALWTIGSVTGPTVIPPAALLGNNIVGDMTAAGFGFVGQVDNVYTFSATNVISGLKATTAGFNFFAQALGLTAGGTGYTTLAGVNNLAEGWGSVTSQQTFSVTIPGTTVPPIPEPSTYALMGLGLVGIGFAARRRAK